MPSMTLDNLRERVHSLTTPARAAGELRLGFGAQLRLGGLHEWFGAENRSGPWSPPLCLLTDVALAALRAGAIRHIVWIGRRCWPYPLLLDQQRQVLRASVLIDPPDDACRLWAIDVALRCPAPSAVIADGHRLTLAHTRRLQLAAASNGALCLIARPARELDELSAAATRWRVSPVPSPTNRPRWSVAQLRNKDRPARMDDRPCWMVEWDDAQGCIRVPPEVACRTGEAAAAC